MIHTNTTCRMCGSTDLTMFLDLGDQPPANRNIKPLSWNTEPEPMYPLKAHVCNECNLVQLLDAVEKEELFEDYPFFSSGSGNTSKHFEEYAEEVQSKFLKPNDLVVEIGGNDGVLLRELKGVRILNVEPARNVAVVAEKRGVKTLNNFFNSDVARRIVKEFGKANLVMGNNSIPHIDNQIEVMRGVKELLAEDGVGIIQAHYLGYIFDTLGYGDIYHEHMSYYAMRPLARFYKKFGLTIFDYKLLPFQGVSSRIYFGHSSRYEESAKVKELMEEELAKNWDKAETYFALAKEIKKSRDKLVATLHNLKQQGKRIAAYGAAAKGVPILNYAGITDKIIDFCIDDLPSKQSLCMPLSHIPIISSEEAKKRKVDYYLLLAWNFRDHIVDKERDFAASGGKFIMPIGDIEIFGL